MVYHIIGLFRKEYNHGEYPTKYYLHTMEFPHIIQINYDFYKDIIDKSTDSVNLPMLRISDYHGKFYYKYDCGKEEN